MDAKTVAAVADWIEYRAGRVRGLKLSQRGLLAEFLRDGSWVDDLQRPRVAEKAAEERRWTALRVGRAMTDAEQSDYMSAVAIRRKRAQEREERERRAEERIRAYFDDQAKLRLSETPTHPGLVSTEIKYP